MKIRNLPFPPHRAVLLAAALTSVGGAGWSAGPPGSGYFEYEQTATPPAGTTDHKLWYKGQNYRRESRSGGSKIITVGNTRGTFVILPGRNEAMKVSGPTRPVVGIPGLPVLDAAAVQRFARRVGAATVGRYKTAVYESRSQLQSAGGRPGQKKPVRQEIITRYWVSRDLPAPVKVAMQTTGLPNGPMVTVLKSARLNLVVPDSMFQVPKGMKISAPTPPRRVSPPPAR